MAQSWQLLGRGTRVLVTGATGFIGANVVRQLLHLGSDVHITVQSSSDPWRLADVLSHVETHVASLTHGDALHRAFVRARPAVVLHLATPRGRDEAARARILEATVTGAIHLLRLAREHDVQRLVVTGSSLEYRPSDAPLTEDAPVDPATVHGAAKAAATVLYRQAALETGVPVSVLRLFHVYGPWESRHRLLPSAIRAALDGTPLPITSGAIARDWVFVADVVDAIVRAVGLDRKRRGHQRGFRPGELERSRCHVRGRHDWTADSYRCRRLPPRARGRGTPMRGSQQGRAASRLVATGHARRRCAAHGRLVRSESRRLVG